MSYVTMVSNTMTTASSSMAGVSPMMLLPPGLPPGFPALMDMLTAPSTGNLLLNTGVGREQGLRLPAAGPWTPTALGPHQVWPLALQQ